MKYTTYHPEIVPKKPSSKNLTAEDYLISDWLLNAPFMGATDEQICASIQAAKNYKDPERVWSKNAVSH